MPKQQSDTEAPPFGLVLDEGASVLDYAIASNPDENWDSCSICGCHGDCASYDRLVTGLILLADQTLARSAWCMRLRCSDERFASIVIPWRAEQ